MTRELTPPVIIIGMHRSGTSLLSRLLEECGIFQGCSKDRYNESLFFQTINESLFRQNKLNWDQPDELGKMLDDNDMLSLSVEYCHHLVNEEFGEYFWGNDPYQSYFGKSKEELFWGWKDPRNTATLPVWLQLFPQSRVIHIVRHGIDVAVSLRRREINRSRVDPHYSNRCQSLQGCFDLWKSYVSIGSEHCRHHSPSLEIYYEDLLSKPGEVMDMLSHFLEIEQPFHPEETLSSINSDRRFACLQDNSLEKFYREVKNDNLLQKMYRCEKWPEFYEHLEELERSPVAGE